MNHSDIQASKDKKYGAYFFILALFIFAYTLIRAIKLSFTWDEAYSYLEFVRNGILVPEKYETMSANNHLLNTWLNIHLINYFGVSEFVLRLPSLCSHLLFLFFSYKLVKDFPNKWLAIISFLIININPYLLDFFSLSRGYGLSIGLMMASIYYLYEFQTKENKKGSALLMVVFGALASAANFVALNYFIVSFGLLTLLLILNFFQSSEKTKEKSILFLKQFSLPAIIFFCSMLFFVPIILKLKEAGALFYGGNKGFWTDTFCTITDRCFYELGYNYWFQRAAKGFVILVVISAAIFLIRKLLKKEKNSTTSFLFSLFFLICMCSLSTIVQHYVLGTLYLIDRTALFLVMLFNLLFVFIINELSKKENKTAVVLYLAGVAAIFHFALSFNFSNVLEWKADSDIKQMITDLNGIKIIPKEKGNINICIPLEFDQGINFYRAKNNLNWINEAERCDIKDKRYDYFFLGPEEYSKLNMDSLEVIKTYPITKNILAKPKYPLSFTKVSLQQNLDFENGPSKKYLIDSKTEYSQGFDYKINDSITPDKNGEVVFEASLMTQDISKNNLYIVISFENKEGLYLWERACIKDYLIKENEWTNVCFSCLVPKDAKAGDDLKAYIWNPKKQTLNVKKMDLKWLSKNN